MKNKLRLIAALALACVIQLSGTGKLWAQNNDCWMKIVFLGYYADYQGFVTSASYLRLCQDYPDLKTIKNLAVDTTGEELYLVIPSEGHDITVNSCTYDMWAQRTDEFEGEILYKTENGFDASLGGRPFLMKCNHSDAYPNTMLVIDGAEGSVTYYPRLDLEQGSLPHHARVRGMSHPLPHSGPDESGQYADMGIRAMVKNGKAVLLFDWDKLNSSGCIPVKKSGNNIWVVPEINGICRQVFIGSIGQNINPWLCLLMDDGTVRTLSIIDALCRNEYAASPALPGFSNIMSFEEGGAGEIEPGVFSYHTIFGIDKAGGRHEIPAFVEQHFHYDALTTEEGNHVSLLLTSNWRISLAVFTEVDMAGYWSGSFFEVASGDGSYDFKFHLRDHFAPEEDKMPDRSGTFRLSMDGDKYTLTPLSGFAFYGKEGQKIELKKKEREW